MLDGLVLWVTYQSFLYSELSKPLIKNPFYDLNTLANSEYMWVLKSILLNLYNDLVYIYILNTIVSELN